MRSVVIVDGYSSGALYAPELRKRGIMPLHVRSSPEVPEIFQGSFRPGDYAEDFRTADPAILETLLRPYAPQAVLAGTETGVPLADVLSERLRLRTNGSALTACRRNKYKMIERLRECGVPVARQCLVDSLSGVAKAVEEIGLPLVMKPIDSAGGEGMRICETESEAEAAFLAIFGLKNSLGFYNRQVLAQEFLIGKEYFLDTVSLDGRSLLTDVGAYVKEGKRRLYREIALVDFHDPVIPDMLAYFLEVLRALGIENGPAHGEIILTPDGPRLVEVGARPAGVGWPELVRLAVGYDQIVGTLDAYLAPSRFRRQRRKGLRKQGEAGIVFTIAEETKDLFSIGNVERYFHRTGE